MISSRLGGNVFSKKIKRFRFNFRKERKVFGPMFSNTNPPESVMSLKALSVITMQISSFRIITAQVTLIYIMYCPVNIISLNITPREIERKTINLSSFLIVTQKRRKANILLTFSLWLFSESNRKRKGSAKEPYLAVIFSNVISKR